MAIISDLISTALSSMTMKNEGSHIYTYTDDGGSGTFVMDCTFSDRFTCAQGLLLSRYSDLSFVSDSNITAGETENLECSGVNIAPKGKKATGGPTLAWLTATFTTPNTSVVVSSSDDINQNFSLVSNWNTNAQYAGEAMKLNGIDWEWTVGPTRITPEDDMNPVKIIPYLETVYEGEWWKIDSASFNNCMGFLNNGTFLGAAQGTLMLTGVAAVQKNSPSGAKWRITYSFGFKKEGWNKFWNAKTTAFDTIRKAGGAASDTIFTAVSYTQLNPGTW